VEPWAGVDAPELLKLSERCPDLLHELRLVVVCKVGLGGIVQVQQVHLQTMGVTCLMGNSGAHQQVTFEHNVTMGLGPYTKVADRAQVHRGQALSQRGFQAGGVYAVAALHVCRLDLARLQKLLHRIRCNAQHIRHENLMFM